MTTYSAGGQVGQKCERNFFCLTYNFFLAKKNWPKNEMPQQFKCSFQNKFFRQQKPLIKWVHTHIRNPLKMPETHVHNQANYPVWQKIWITVNYFGKELVSFKRDIFCTSFLLHAIGHIFKFAHQWRHFKFQSKFLKFLANKSDMCHWSCIKSFCGLLQWPKKTIVLLWNFKYAVIYIGSLADFNDPGKLIVAKRSCFFPNISVCRNCPITRDFPHILSILHKCNAVLVFHPQVYPTQSVSYHC